ncbi:MAG: flavodoxin-dependent (E)-4-hydroxy-3-methylbut-2-enyl-diphosphate synthase [Bacilli bacterium]
MPATAMEAVEHVEKIRVNPGNFTDKKLDGKPDYTDAEYEAELDKVRQKFTPLVLRCKELGRALRIGTNHGSLSDRIIRRYGDTSYGMVEAAFEFARICRDLNFHNFCFSFKASNTRIMTQTYRLAVKMMKEEGFSYPHLGVTEAGFGTDARIKSSMGIGGLLFDGIGDTIRVSLTEDPVEEIPVAKDLARLAESVRAKKAAEQFDEKIDFYSYNRRESICIDCGTAKIGKDNVPAVASFGKSQKADIQLDGSQSDKIKIKSYEASESAKLAQDLKESVIAAQIKTRDLDKFSRFPKLRKLNFNSARSEEGRHAVGEARALAARLKSSPQKPRSGLNSIHPNL